MCVRTKYYLIGQLLVDSDKSHSDKSEILPSIFSMNFQIHNIILKIIFNILKPVVQMSIWENINLLSETKNYNK